MYLYIYISQYITIYHKIHFDLDDISTISRRLHVSPIVVIDGFQLAFVELLKGHPAIAVAVHLLVAAGGVGFPNSPLELLTITIGTEITMGNGSNQ